MTKRVYHACACGGNRDTVWVLRIRCRTRTAGRYGRVRQGRCGDRIRPRARGRWGHARVAPESNALNLSATPQSPYFTEREIRRCRDPDDTVKLGGRREALLLPAVTGRAARRDQVVGRHDARVAGGGSRDADADLLIEET